ncbi:hypothetical protein [Acinetobacter puyangensis]|uniref:DUF4179 domain-containing protein n=1 Tax=Acinetobacter puyangensis TaxID=1096779 RepID=A0A240E8X7_9GAMM|nr:hypothetical protein [Acinetobacter puyangensis]SNX44340.1 hypothetical protein SAMN05421731_10375 [Acinetobacter puyangensis]
MRYKSIMLIISLSCGVASVSDAAQLQPQSKDKKEVSIIKNVAASLKPVDKPLFIPNQTVLDQLLKETEQQQTITVSKEESRAVARLNNYSPNPLLSENKKISSIFKRLFGG